MSPVKLYARIITFSPIPSVAKISPTLEKVLSVGKTHVLNIFGLVAGCGTGGTPRKSTIGTAPNSVSLSVSLLGRETEFPQEGSKG
jgi:hypothetical protein